MSGPDVPFVVVCRGGIGAADVVVGEASIIRASTATRDGWHGPHHGASVTSSVLRAGGRTNADFGLRFRTEVGSRSCVAVGPDEVQGRWKRTERRRF